MAGFWNRRKASALGNKGFIKILYSIINHKMKAIQGTSGCLLPMEEACHNPKSFGEAILI